MGPRSVEIPRVCLWSPLGRITLNHIYLSRGSRATPDCPNWARVPSTAGPILLFKEVQEQPCLISVPRQWPGR
jgi:hypothetical protein